ncbi:MAG TPA: polysaccharide biosynthesis C-terminal domain-containing protein, partial [Pirellulaceae bacterium]|nr:polysaccharide biosynthesis C-terminal domain-containing protein [Pirellulaceae bacterium]
LIQLLSLAGFVAVVTLLAALTQSWYSVNPNVCWVILSLTLTMPGILLWEFVRRQAFAMMEMRSAAVLDGCLAVLQLTGLLALGFLGQLTVARALFLIAISSTCVGVVRLLQQRSRFQYSCRLAGLDIRKNWRFGRWFFAGQIVGLAQAYAVPWILTLAYGAEQTGILMACQTLVLLSNPMLLGLANWLGPASVRTYVSDGLAGLNRLLIKVSLLSHGCMVAFAIMLYFLGEWILVLTFGSGYAGYGHLVAITGITALGFSMTVSGSSGLAAIQRPRLIMYGTLVGSIVSVATLPSLVHHWGLTGAAWALAAGSLTTGLIQVLGYVFISKAISGRASLADVRGN